MICNWIKNNAKFNYTAITTWHNVIIAIECDIYNTNWSRYNKIEFAIECKNTIYVIIYLLQVCVEW